MEGTTTSKASAASPPWAVGSATVSFSGHRAAAMRRRNSTSSSSGTSTLKGRTSLRAMEVSAWVMVVSFRGRRVAVTALAEGEGVGLDAGVVEGDLEGALADRAGLANQ